MLYIIFFIFFFFTYLGFSASGKLIYRQQLVLFNKTTHTQSLVKNRKKGLIHDYISFANQRLSNLNGVEPLEADNPVGTPPSDIIHPFVVHHLTAL